MPGIMQFFSSAGDLMLVILGFGLIIFLHELGHFVAARWAGVRVLAFAIGFGPALLTFRKGLGVRRGSSEDEYFRRQRTGDASLSPTEYRLNALPLGGYVKMLGQDDLDPGAVSAAPDSYQSCKPWRRMIIISAGVIANLISAAVIFVIVFMIGMQENAPMIGSVMPNSPAAQAEQIGVIGATHSGIGLKPGDTILEIDDKPIDTFGSVGIAVAMAKRDQPLTFQVRRPGEPDRLTFRVVPKRELSTNLLGIGITPSDSTRIYSSKNKKTHSFIQAELSKIGLADVAPGSRLVSINGVEVRGIHEAHDIIRHCGGVPLAMSFISDTGVTSTATISPTPILERNELRRSNGKPPIRVEHLLGLQPLFRVILPQDADVKPEESRAFKLGLREGDIFARLGEREFPSVAQGVLEIQAHAGRIIPVVVLRESDSGYQEIPLSNVTVKSDGQIGISLSTTASESALIALPPDRLWNLANPFETGNAKNASAASASPDVGLVPPAAGVFTSPGTRIVSINGKAISTFYDIRTAIATAKPGSLEITVQRPVAGIPRTDAPTELIRWTLTAEEIDLAASVEWDWAGLGIFESQMVLIKADGPVEALKMGAAKTREIMLQTYLTFARLIQGSVRVEHLKGPVGIAHLGTMVADRGLIWLLFFLGLISINLAVINFLPLPIVDGGQFLFLLFEQIRGKPVPIVVQNVATFVGLALIGVMFIVVTFNDIRNLIGK